MTKMVILVICLPSDLELERVWRDCDLFPANYTNPKDQPLCRNKQ